MNKFIKRFLNFFEKAFFVSSESIARITLSKFFDIKHLSTVLTTIGLPFKGVNIFLGKRFELRRAGIIPIFILIEKLPILRLKGQRDIWNKYIPYSNLRDSMGSNCAARHAG